MQQRIRGLLPLALVVLLLGAATWLATRWLERTLSASGVAARMSEQLGRDVRIRSLDVHFTPWLRVRLEGVVIGSEATLEAVEIGPRLSALLRGRAEAGRIEIEAASLKLTRNAQGAFGLGEGTLPDHAPGTPGPRERGALPEIQLRSATVELVDFALGPEPVRTHLQLESVSLEPSLLTAEAHLQGVVRVGTVGDRGELRLRAKYDLEDGSIEGSIETRAVAIGPLRPYLAQLSDLDLEGPVEGELALSWQGDTLALRDLRLRAPRLAWPDGGPDLARIELSVESIDLQGVGAWDGLPASVSVRDLSIGYERSERPERIHLAAASLETLDEDAGRRLEIEASAGLEPGRAPLSLRAISAPLAPATPAGSLPFDAELELDPIDPSLLMGFLPAEWGAGAHGAQLEGTARLSGSLSEGVRGQAQLALPSGALAIGGLEIVGPASVQGALTTGDGGLRIDAAHVGAAQATLGEHMATGVRALLHWDGAVVDLETIDLATYDGILVLADELDVDGPELHLTKAERLSGSGPTGPWPMGGMPWLRVPSELTVVGAEATLVDARSGWSEPLPALVSQSHLRGFALGEVAALELRAALGDPPGSLGDLELEGSYGPIGEPSQTLSLEATVRGLEPLLLLSYTPAAWSVSGRPGPLDGTASLRAFADRRLRAEVELRVSSGTLAIGDLTLAAPIRWQGSVDRVDGSFSVRDGRLHAAGVRVADLEAEELSAQHALEGTTLTLDPLAWRAYGGSWEQRGTLTLSGPPSFDLTAKVEGADFARMSGRASEGDPTLLRGRAELRGSWHGAERWLEGIEGTGSLELRDGMLPGSGLMRAVWNALAGRIPGVGSVLERDAETPPARLLQARLPFRIEQARVSTDALEIATDDYVLTGKGHVIQSGDVRLNGEIQFTAQGVSRLLSLGAVPQGVRRGFALPSIPVEARGPAEAMTYRADVRRVPLASLQGLLGVPGRATDAVRGVGDAARGAGRRLMGDQPSEQEPEAP